MRIRGLLLLAPFLVACGAGVGASPATPPAPVVPASADPAEPIAEPGNPRGLATPRVPSDVADSLPVGEVVETSRDAVLDSPWLDHPSLETRVDFWVDHWQGRGAGDFERYLERMGHYGESVSKRIEAMGLPESLRYLPIVESGYNPVAVSGVGATGLWQFMAPTARYLGLDVTALTDQRRDPFVSTVVALDYLHTLNEQFDSWLLALAAYNAGPGRVSRLIRQHVGAGEQGDSIFRVIHPHLPPETRDFVPRFVAASRMAAEPELYGFGEVEPEEAIGFDEVTVPDATSLDVVARAAGVPMNRIEGLNPQFLRGMTPQGVETTLRVPEDHGVRFAQAYALIPPGERVTFVEHRVVSGETMGHIAQRFGIRLAELQAANPRIDPRRLQIGQRLVVPMVRASGGGGGTAVALAGTAMAGTRTYRVVSGDSLWGIARRHNLSVNELARLNGMSEDRTIHPGDELVIRGGR